MLPLFICAIMFNISFDSLDQIRWKNNMRDLLPRAMPGNE